jgi:hypothetical protein
MVTLHLGHVLRQPGVVERIVHAVVEHVECERAGDDTVCDGFGEEEVRELGEGSLQTKEEGGRHDESQLIHGKVVVDAVEEEVKEHRPVLVRQIVVDVEEEAVEGVFEDGPDDVTGKEGSHGLAECLRSGDGESGQGKGKEL